MGYNGKTFGQWLKWFRKRAGISRRSLAEMTGWSQSSIHDWELDKRLPSRDAVKQLADAIIVLEWHRDILYMAAGYLPPSFEEITPYAWKALRGYMEVDRIIPK